MLKNKKQKETTQNEPVYSTRYLLGKINKWIFKKNLKQGYLKKKFVYGF